MKKVLCLLVSALLAGSAFAQEPAKVGLYRTQLEPGYFSELKSATVGDITVETIMGTTTKDVDLDNDENYGTSTEQPRYRGENAELENGTGRIFPIVELGARDESSFYGFKMTIPEGKKVNIDRLVASGMFGNAFTWAVTISQNGNVLYDTNNLKINAYNKDFVYIDSLNITSTSAAGLSEETKTYLLQWFTGDEETLMEQGKWKKGNYLTDAVKDLTGEVEVKFYYFGKNKKALAVGNLYVEAEVLDAGTTGITTVVTEKRNNNRIFSIDGRYVGTDKAGLVKGLYIQNGKKFVVK